jgi:hypothetical protein
MIIGHTTGLPNAQLHRRPKAGRCKLMLDARHPASCLWAVSSGFYVSANLITVFTRVPDMRKCLLKVRWRLSRPRERVLDERRPPPVERSLCPSCGNGLCHDRPVTNGVEDPGHREDCIAAIEAVLQERSIDQHGHPPFSKDAANGLD